MFVIQTFLIKTNGRITYIKNHPVYIKVKVKFKLYRNNSKVDIQHIKILSNLTIQMCLLEHAILQ